MIHGGTGERVMMTGFVEEGGVGEEERIRMCIV